MKLYHRKGLRSYPHELSFDELCTQKELCSGTAVEAPYGKRTVLVCSICNRFISIGTNLTPIELRRNE